MARLARLSTCALMVAAAQLSACSGGSDTPPDAQVADAMSLERLAAEINNDPICNGQFTEGMSAVVESATNRVVVRGSCTDGSDDIYLIFSPYTEGGATPCSQATFRDAQGVAINCRLNNDQLMPPTGELTMADGHAVGTCDCATADSNAAAEFDLLVQP